MGTTKERFDFLVRNNLRYAHQEYDVVKAHVNMLIDALYIPVKEEGMIKMVDPQRVRLFHIEQEPINWGDLKCFDVEKMEDGAFQITIDEASPGNCPTFCKYITEYMKAYGWRVRVLTEW